MNLNTSLQEKAPEANFKGIKFTCENFETIYISAKHIDNLDLYSSDMEETYESIVVIFNKDFKNNKPKILERIMERRDITYIDIYCQDETKNLEILVPYEDDEFGFNKLQDISEFQGGEIILEFIKK